MVYVITGKSPKGIRKIIAESYKTKKAAQKEASEWHKMKIMPTGWKNLRVRKIRSKK